MSNFAINFVAVEGQTLIRATSYAKTWPPIPCPIYLRCRHVKWVSVITLTHWGRVTQICVSNLNTIGSGNGLSPGRRQAITWTNAGILLIGPLGTNFSEILIEIPTFSFKKMRLKVSSAKWQPFCLGLNALRGSTLVVVCLKIVSTTTA